MNTHEYGTKLKELGEFLLSRPVFEADGEPFISLWYWADKDGFLGAVKALGSGRKEYEGSGDSGYIHFDVSGVPMQTRLRVTALRSVACRKIQEEKWECEPLLTQVEESQLTSHKQD